MCSTLKKLLNKEQPFREVIKIIEEIVWSKQGNFSRIINQLILYAEYQFGKEVAGNRYRERADGERVDNWIVDIENLHGLNSRLVGLYLQNESISLVKRAEMCVPHTQRSLSLLTPWLNHLDLDDSNRNDDRKEWQRGFLVNELYHVEQNMATWMMNRRDFDAADGHCQRCLAYSRRDGIKGDKISNIIHSLRTFCSLRGAQDDFPGAIPFAEEAYNLAVVAHDPAHPQVQEAAGILIDILIEMGDYYNAELCSGHL
jgi:hypothetical protein